VSVFQAATQINEMTLSFIPKLLAIFAVTALAGPWMLGLLVDFTRRLYTAIPGMIG
jgi:flagellar biosynthetic protein FliQ